MESTGVPRCKECNKLYKRTEENEHGLCPKCLELTAKAIGGAEADGSDQQANPMPEPQPEAIKPGQAIRNRFTQLIEQGLITNEVLAVLLDREATAKATGIRYAFLKEYDADRSIKEITYINGSARYSSKPVTINGKQYLITNDLYKATVPKFIDWADSLNT